MRKVHWRPGEPISWPCGGKRQPRLRTFLLAHQIVCHVKDAPATSLASDVTCGRCLRIMSVSRFDTNETVNEILARGNS